MGRVMMTKVGAGVAVTGAGGGGSVGAGGVGVGPGGLVGAGGFVATAVDPGAGGTVGGVVAPGATGVWVPRGVDDVGRTGGTGANVDSGINVEVGCCAGGDVAVGVASGPSPTGRTVATAVPPTARVGVGTAVAAPAVPSPAPCAPRITARRPAPHTRVAPAVRRIGRSRERFSFCSRARSIASITSLAD